MNKIKTTIPCQSRKRIPLPLFSSTVKAGFPSPADDFIEHQLDLNELIIQHPAATFFVRANGNSMLGAGIRSGDILVVDRSLTASNGKIVIALLNGEFTVKRLQVDPKGKGITLHSENEVYSPIEVPDESDFQVWGVVTYVIHRT